MFWGDKILNWPTGRWKLSYFGACDKIILFMRIENILSWFLSSVVVMGGPLVSLSTNPLSGRLVSNVYIGRILLHNRVSFLCWYLKPNHVCTKKQTIFVFQRHILWDGVACLYLWCFKASLFNPILSLPCDLISSFANWLQVATVAIVPQRLH